MTDKLKKAQEAEKALQCAIRILTIKDCFNVSDVINNLQYAIEFIKQEFK